MQKRSNIQKRILRVQTAKEFSTEESWLPSAGADGNSVLPYTIFFTASTYLLQPLKAASCGVDFVSSVPETATAGPLVRREINVADGVTLGRLPPLRGCGKVRKSSIHPQPTPRMPYFSPKQKCCNHPLNQNSKNGTESMGKRYQTLPDIARCGHRVDCYMYFGSCLRFLFRSGGLVFHPLVDFCRILLT